MKNVFLALLHEWAENSLKEVTVIFIERKYFNKMFCPWTGVIPCVPGHLIPRAKPKHVGLENKQTNACLLPAASQLRTGAAEMDFLLVKHSVNLCSWNSSLKTGHSCPCLPGFAARQAGERLRGSREHHPYEPGLPVSGILGIRCICQPIYNVPPMAWLPSTLSAWKTRTAPRIN